MSEENRTLVHYLSSIRAACNSIEQETGDATNQKALALISQILSSLIVKYQALPDFQAKAAIEYQKLLQQYPEAKEQVKGEDFHTIRSQVQNAIRQEKFSSGKEISQGIVEIEQGYFQEYEEAFQKGIASRKKSGATNGNEDNGLDINNLTDYLSAVFDTEIEVTNVDTASLGWSKATYLVEVSENSKSPAALVIRMDQANSQLGTTVNDEYPVLEVLFKNQISVPRPFSHEVSGDVLGQPFIVVERVYGQNVGSHFIPPEPNSALCEVMAANLAKIHAIPVSEFGEFLNGVKQTPEQQMQAEIDKYYGDWAMLNVVSPIVEASFQWIRKNAELATRGGRTLVHGDYSLSNILVNDEQEISAILDWEFAGLGNPASDVGWFYFMASRLGTWEGFLNAYHEAGAPMPEEEQLDFYILWGALKLLVMNYQANESFESGRASDLKQAYPGTCFLREAILRVSGRLNNVYARNTQRL